MDTQSALEASLDLTGTGRRSAETSLPSVFSLADLRAPDLAMEDPLNACAAGQQSNSAAARSGAGSLRWQAASKRMNAWKCSLCLVLSESLPGRSLHHWHLHCCTSHLQGLPRHAACPGASGLPASPHWQRYQTGVGLLCMHQVQLCRSMCSAHGLKPQHCHQERCSSSGWAGSKVPASADVMHGTVMCLTIWGWGSVLKLACGRPVALHCLYMRHAVGYN